MTNWNTTPRPTITTLGHQPPTEGATITIAAEPSRLRTIAPGQALSVNSHRFNAGDSVLLTSAQAADAEARGLLMPLGHREAPKPAMVGRVEELDVMSQMHAQTDRGRRGR